MSVQKIPGKSEMNKQHLSKTTDGGLQSITNDEYRKKHCDFNRMDCADYPSDRAIYYDPSEGKRQLCDYSADSLSSFYSCSGVHFCGEKKQVATCSQDKQALASVWGGGLLTLTRCNMLKDRASGFTGV